MFLVVHALSRVCRRRSGTLSRWCRRPPYIAESEVSQQWLTSAPVRHFTTGAAATERYARVREVQLPPGHITVHRLAEELGVEESELVSLLADLGEEDVSSEAALDLEVAQLLALEHGFTVTELSGADEVSDAALVHKTACATPGSEKAAAAPAGARAPRIPVVAVMGHVDHGKTSLLDALRCTRVADGEEGGITQRIGAFQADGLTWLDTPGHALFSAMRERGAAVTDVALLVVAADEGAQPQTVEAVRQLRAAVVPFIVALNKMDKPGADAHAARASLLEHGVVVEELGGDVPSVEVSAVKRTGLDAMCELIRLQAELLELDSRPRAALAGTVIEADASPRRGVIATALLSQGTLRQGDFVVAGTAWGRVRALTRDDGCSLRSVTAGVPVEVAGFKTVPASGDGIAVVGSERRARQLVEARRRRSMGELSERVMAERRARVASRAAALATAKDPSADRQPLSVPVVVKAESAGGLEAMVSALATIPGQRAHALVVHAAVGAVTEHDVQKAHACDAAILAYNVKAAPRVRQAAEGAGITLACSPIVYTLLDAAREVLVAALPPERDEEHIGRAEVLDTFVITASAGLRGKGAPKRPVVGGMRILDGSIRSNAHLRVVRTGEVVWEGPVLSLRSFKDDVAEVTKGSECGVILQGGWTGWQRGDEVQALTFTERRPSLDH